MSKSDDPTRVLIDQAQEKYGNKNRSQSDLLECESLYLQALDARRVRYGPGSMKVAWVHNRLGLVYLALGDHFAQGQGHFTEAARIYKDPADKAIVANNHANLLWQKGQRILAKSLSATQDGATRDDAPVSAAGSGRFRLFRGANTDASSNEEVLALKVLALKAQATTSNEVLDLFRQADEMRRKAFDLARDTVRAERKKAAGDAPEKKKVEPIVYKSPAAIMAILNTVAIGQRAAKRGLANAAAQHIKRMQMSAEDRAKTDKSNVLLLGPTGCGKTLLARGLAQAINVPIYCTEATKFTAAGYVGEDVQSILVGLLRACAFDIERAQNGIVYLDEIDKIAAKVTRGEKDVGGKAVQEALLTILEGTKISVPKDGNKRSTGEYLEIDTTNILFIVGGAFVGLGETVSRRMASANSTIGFGAAVRDKEEDKSRYMEFASAEDFIDFGMIPEFIGRLPKRLVIEALSIDQLERILVEPDKALARQKRLLLASTTDLRFTRGALRAIAEEAHKTGTHGRALSEIMEQVLEPVVFDEPKMVTITAEMVLNRQAEIRAKNQEDDGVMATASLDFIVEDDDLTATSDLDVSGEDDGAEATG